jgi:hypothetical protein
MLKVACVFTLFLLSVNGTLLGIQSDFFASKKTLVSIDPDSGVVTQRLVLGSFPNSADFIVYDSNTNSSLYSPGTPPQIVVVDTIENEITKLILVTNPNGALQSLALDSSNSTAYALVKKDPNSPGISIVQVNIRNGNVTTLKDNIPGVKGYTEKCLSAFDEQGQTLYYWCTGYELWYVGVNSVVFQLLYVENPVVNIRYDQVENYLVIEQITNCFEVGYISSRTKLYTKVACLWNINDIGYMLAGSGALSSTSEFVDIFTPLDYKTKIVGVNITTGIVKVASLSVEDTTGQRITATVFTKQIMNIH